nr:DUF2249 domain-containing protein [Haloarcula sp. Atlit-120R]
MVTETELDLRALAGDRLHEHLFEALNDAAAGDKLGIVTDRDIDPELVRYQIAQERVIDWEYADPDAVPRELTLTVGGRFDDEDSATIDVRDLKPQRRHEVLLTIFEELDADEGFVLVNDHDPKPLYHELRSMHGDIIEWEYVSRGDDGWRVEIYKTADSETVDDAIVTRYDVREIPKQERHPTIHHRYGMIPDGGTMEIMLPTSLSRCTRSSARNIVTPSNGRLLNQHPGAVACTLRKAVATTVQKTWASLTMCRRMRRRRQLLKTERLRENSTFEICLLPSATSKSSKPTPNSTLGKHSCS